MRSPEIAAPPGFAPLRLALLPSGLEVELTRPSMVAGRHSDCDVRLPLADVSRRHARFYFADGAWWVEDLDSLNGVEVNEVRVAASRVAPGDRVRLGGVTFAVLPRGRASRPAA